MTRKRKLTVILIYISIIAAMLLMFFYVQKRYGHILSKKRTEIPVTVSCIVGCRSDTFTGVFAPVRPYVGGNCALACQNEC